MGPAVRDISLEGGWVAIGSFPWESAQISVSVGQSP